MDANDRKLIIQIVGQVLISDGALTDAEREHLEGLVESYEMDDAARREALGGISVDSPIEERVKELSEAGRARIVEIARGAAVADGGASRAEQGMIERIEASVR